jgi:CheY-like chemotaxis protein
MMIESGEPAAASRLAGAKVLVAEDEPVIALDLQAMLQDLGCLVLGPVESIQSALAVLAQERPDAVLLDVSLLDGRAAPVAVVLMDAAVPFALMTAYGEGELDDSCFAAAPRIAKPFGAETVKQMVLQLLRDSRETVPDLSEGATPMPQGS